MRLGGIGQSDWELPPSAVYEIGVGQNLSSWKRGQMRQKIFKYGVDSFWREGEQSAEEDEVCGERRGCGGLSLKRKLGAFQTRTLHWVIRDGAGGWMY